MSRVRRWGGGDGGGVVDCLVAVGCVVDAWVVWVQVGCGGDMCGWVGRVVVAGRRVCV